MEEEQDEQLLGRDRVYAALEPAQVPRSVGYGLRELSEGVAQEEAESGARPGPEEEPEGAEAGRAVPAQESQTPVLRVPPAGPEGSRSTRRFVGAPQQASGRQPPRGARGALSGACDVSGARGPRREPAAEAAASPRHGHRGGRGGGRGVGGPDGPGGV